MSCGIYKITNQVNGKCYIGQSKNIEERWKNHKNYRQENSDYPLYIAFKEYGIQNFLFEIIEECLPEELNEKEIYWIQQFDSYNNGYNQTSGGAGNPNNVIKISQEDIKIIYDLLLNSTITQKEIAKMFELGEDTISEINTGKTRIDPNLDYPLRKRKSKTYCIQCGKEISDGAERCVQCLGLLHRKVEHPSRQELKNMIRTIPFTTIAKQYGVSDKAISKWCINEKLPSKKSEIRKYTDEEWELI